MLKLDEISEQFDPMFAERFCMMTDKDTLHVMISNNQVSQPCNAKSSMKLRLYYNIFPRFENFM